MKICIKIDLYVEIYYNNSRFIKEGDIYKSPICRKNIKNRM